MSRVSHSSSRRRVLHSLVLAPVAFAASGGANAQAQWLKWPTTQPTPPFELESLDGRQVSLAALRGTPLLLNFWASWCEPCRAEMPSLELLEARYAAAGLKVLTINFRETDGTVRRFVEQTGLSLTVLRDRDGGTAQAYGVRVFPTTVAIDHSGRARFLVRGEIDWLGREASAWMRPLLGAPAATA